MSAPATASPATASPAPESPATVSLATVSLATASGALESLATKVIHFPYRSSYIFEDRRGGRWAVGFSYDSGKPKVQTLKNMSCRYILDYDGFSLDDFCGSFLHETAHVKYGRVSSHILLTQRSVPEMVNLINCAGTAPKMFESLMSVLSSTSTSSVEQSHLSDLAGIVKFVNQIYAKKSEEIPECYQVIDPENLTKFEKIFPPTFGWVRAFCKCDRSFRQYIACGDILETCLNNFAQHCTDEIKKKMDESETVKTIKEVSPFITSASADDRSAFESLKNEKMKKVLVHETEKFLANSKQVVEDWLATLV
jgi:hypothetical protein